MPGRRISHGRLPVLIIFSTFCFLTSTLQAQRPSDQYKAALLSGRTEPRVRAFVAVCLGTERLPKPVQIYSQGAWFVTEDLASQVRDEGSDDDGTAQVWAIDSKPRAISMWVHDDEFDRHTLACLNDHGIVTRLQNEYMPGLSEPDLHWVFIHTFTLVTGNKYHSASRYTDWTGHPVSAPRLTSEDRDFIAGERHYTQWSNFDFATVYDQDHQK